MRRPLRIELRREAGRGLAFAAVFASLYLAASLAWNAGLSRLVIDQATVRPAAWLSRQLSGDPSIVADGDRLRSASATIHVLPGCDGTDVLMLLAAALTCAPLRLRDRAAGIAAGAVLVLALNQARVVALLFALRLRSPWFGPLHGLIAPLAIAIAVTVYVVAWTRRASRPAPARDAA